MFEEKAQEDERVLWAYERGLIWCFAGENFS
jgi:hypothetical protein